MVWVIIRQRGVSSERRHSSCSSLNQCWNIVNWTLRNKIRRNRNRNSYIFIQENAFINIVCDMVTILCQPQCVNSLGPRRSGSNFQSIIFKLKIQTTGLHGHLLRNWSHVNTTEPYWGEVNIGSGNGLVTSGNKPLLEPLLTKIYVTIWRH